MPGLIWYVGWAVVGLMVGTVAFNVAPIIAAPFVSREKRQELGRKFGHMSMFAYGRALLIRRKHGGMALKRSSYDAEKGGETVTLDDETLYWEDPNRQMQLLQSKKFGCVYEKSNMVSSPRLAAIAKTARDYVKAGKHVVHVSRAVEADGGMAERTQRLFSTHVPLPAGSRMVDLAWTASGAPGCGDPGDADTAEEYTKLSQAGFKSPNLMDTLELLIAYGLGVLAMWALAQVGGAGGGGGIAGPSVSLFMGVPF